MVRDFTPSTQRALCFFLLISLASAQTDIPTFGTTVIDSFGLRGDIYFLPPDSDELPNFKRLHSIGSIYATSLNVPPRDFKEGFPGLTNRMEWFAIDYNGRFWLDRAKTLRFALESDDGSRLYIDGRLVIDNDGNHPPSGCVGQAELSRGTHLMRVSYFQGPRFFVALMLGVASETGGWQVFDTRNFKPPADFDPALPKHPLRKLKRGNCWAR